MSEPQAEFIVLSDLGPPIQIPFRYSKKSKHISIRINHNGPELVLPNKNLNAGKKFLLTKESWVRGKLQKLEKHEDIIDNNSLPILGKIYSLEYIEDSRNKVEMKGNILYIQAKTQKHNDVLTKFLKELLLEEIIEITDFLRQKHNLNFSQIKITNNKTRWGSCSSTGIISFNWRLIFASKEVVDYLIVHEMCHLTHMNHSKKFWDLVDHIYPDYKEAKLWLRKNGRNLHQYLS